MGQMDLRRKTPVMGWASWNCFRTNISEEVLKRQANALVETGLADCGYEYFNMDDGFFGGRGADGRVQMHSERFPNGIKAIADYAHSLGLKAGTYAEGGDKTCGFYYDQEGANGSCVGLYGHEEQDLRMYLQEFGFDFIKVDWCGGLRMGLDEKEQYTKIGHIIEKIRQETGRTIVYNVCRWQFPGPWVTEIADSWRTGGDIQPQFSSVLQQIDNIKSLAKYCGPGHVNDLDMMQIGNGLSAEEEKTHFAMWCMMSTPLMIGCDLTKISESTLEILKNKEMIAINQDSACHQAFLIKQICSQAGELIGEVWVKNLGKCQSAKKAVAFLNRSDGDLEIKASSAEIGLQGAILSVRDVWAHEDLETAQEYSVKLLAHGVSIYVITAEECGKEVNIYEENETPFEQSDMVLLADEEAYKLMDEGAVLVDVREPYEYAEAHLEGAINISYTGIHAEAATNLTDKAEKIIVYCKTGKRCTQAMKSLRYLGYKNVYAWKVELIDEETNAIYPGQEWLDNNGNRIQAHGGSIFYENDTFYWYGENKEKTAPGNGILQWGVRCYSSKDMYHWKDEGLLIEPDTENKDSLLHPSSKAERPHILYNEKTKKYVCWIKVIRDSEQVALVLQADSFFGPYEIIRNGYKPLGMCMGDFDLAKDVDGKAYLIFEKVHTDLICAQLTEEYTDVTGEYAVIAAHEQPPYVREAPAHFMYQGKHYVFTSGTTGYHPNPSESAVADTFLGKWNVLGDAHPEDASRTSYNSQITSVFKHPRKKNLYIALADRWMPYLRDLDPEGFDCGKTYEAIKNNFIWSFSEDLELKKRAKWTVPAPNTSLADYVWLPVTFENGVPTLRWRDKWSIEEYE